MKKRTSFIKLIQFWGIIFLTGIGASIIILDIFMSYRDFHTRSEKMRTDHIVRQKQMIRQEVECVVDMIKYEKAQSETVTMEKIKSRVLEAYSIARHIYEQNKTTKSRVEIQAMILEALRPIRFEQGTGYYFIIRLDGVEMLNADKPEMEGKNLLGLQDTHGKYVVKDITEIAWQSHEGFYEYHWKKPDEEGNDFKKISFIKRFEPFDWIIGSGLYVDDIEKKLIENLLPSISKIRFGKEGYVFINRLNGDALVSNGKLLSGTKKLWEVFNTDPEKMKKIFTKEYHAALKPEGDYIYYSHIKLTDPEKESPKASFIYGIPELQWLVGAGVYLDDVEADIGLMQTELNNQIKAKMLYFVLIVTGIVVLYLFLFSRLNRRLVNDFKLFISFFNRAALSDEKIKRDLVQFEELDRMAENANRMLRDKTRARQNLLDEREKLRQSEQFLNSVFESIQDGITILNPDLTIRHVNGVMNKWYSENLPLEGNKCFACYHNADKPCDPCPILRCLESGRTETDVMPGLPGSEVKWIELYSYPIRNSENGKIDGAVGFVRDITQRRQAEEALRESEANLRLVFEAATNVAFIKTDTNGKETKITEFSPGAEKIFGYKAEEVIGRPVAMLHLREDVEKFPQVLETMSKTGEGFSGEITLIKKSGETFSTLITVHPVFDDDGKMTASIGVSIDISEQKKAEEELQKMERLKSIGALAGGIAHDFNNILMGLFGNISIAKEDLASDHPGHKALKEAEKSMNRAIRLTRQLLTFAKGSGPVREDVSLGELMEDIVSFDLSGSNIKPVFKLANDLWLAEVDKGQIQQVFSNLTINAKQAMPDGGHLFITMENADLSEESLPGLQPGKYIKVTVRDEGSGIHPKQLERVFDPYFTTKQTGSGLGLATTYSIINRHGGHISVDSQPGKGTVFTLYLPASEAERLPETKAFPAKPATEGERGRILVMDDEETIRYVASQMLKKSGYEVKTADDGKQAIEMYSQALDSGEPFDVIIMDLTIPGGMGGKEAIKEILALDPEAKAIVSSGYADDRIMANYVEYGFRDIVSKPYSVGQLQEVLSRVLKK